MGFGFCFKAVMPNGVKMGWGDFKLGHCLHTAVIMLLYRHDSVCWIPSCISSKNLVIELYKWGLKKNTFLMVQKESFVVPGQQQNLQFFKWMFDVIGTHQQVNTELYFLEHMI